MSNSCSERISSDISMLPFHNYQSMNKLVGEHSLMVRALMAFVNGLPTSEQLSSARLADH